MRYLKFLLALSFAAIVQANAQQVHPGQVQPDLGELRVLALQQESCAASAKAEALHLSGQNGAVLEQLCQALSKLVSVHRDH